MQDKLDGLHDNALFHLENAMRAKGDGSLTDRSNHGTGGIISTEISS
jgi:hypothetical protein